MTSFDGEFYLKNLDSVLHYMDEPSKEVVQNKTKKAMSATWKFIALNFNKTLGDKHWYDNTIARQAVDYYLWKGEFHPLKDQLIIKICQKLAKLENTEEQAAGLAMAERVCKHLPDVSNKLLFHILGDEFGLNSSLEGMKSSESLEFLYKFLKEKKEKGQSIYNIGDDLLNEIRMSMLLSLSLEEKIIVKTYTRKCDGETYTNQVEMPPVFLEHAKQKLQDTFVSQKPLLLPGGWVGKPTGHAMYYEVIPTGNGKASFRLYNLGDGAEIDHAEAIINGKKKTCPFAEWRGIDESNLLNDSFIQALYQTGTYAELNKKPTMYSALDIYQGLQELLKPETIMQDHEAAPAQMMTEQRAGTCSWRSLMAFLSTRMDKADYKRLILDVEFQALSNRVSKVESPQQIEWQLIQKSHQKLSRKTAKAYRQKMISEGDLIEDLKQLSIVQHYLKTHKPNYKKSRLSVQPMYQSPESPVPNDLSIQSLAALHQQINAIDVVDNHIPQADPRFYQQLVELTSLPLSKSLIEAKALCQKAFDAKSHQALELGMIEYTLSLPSNVDKLRNSFKGDVEATKNAIANLGFISQLFFKNSFLVNSSEVVHPRRLFVLEKLLWAQYTLACQIDPIWKSVFYLSPCTSEHELFYSYYDARLAENQGQLSRSSYGTYRLNRRYNSNAEMPVAKNISISFETDKEDYSRSDKDFTDILADMAPEAYQKLSQQDTNFSKRAEFSQRAHLYASGHLPDWLKAIRDTHLELLYLAGEPVAKPPLLNGDLNLKLQVQDDKERSLIWVSVDGIDGNILSHYPVLEEMRKNPGIRFAGIHRPFIPPQMHKIFLAMNKLIPSMNSHEKKAVCAEASQFNVDLPNEEFKEILHLVSSPRCVHQEALAYFKNHPEKLKDPDFQTLFKILFFSKGIATGLEQELREHNTFSDNLASFIASSYKHYHAQNELQTCVSCCKSLITSLNTVPIKIFIRFPSRKFVGCFLGNLWPRKREPFYKQN